MAVYGGSHLGKQSRVKPTTLSFKKKKRKRPSGGAPWEPEAGEYLEFEAHRVNSRTAKAT